MNSCPNWYSFSMRITSTKIKTDDHFYSYIRYKRVKRLKDISYNSNHGAQFWEIALSRQWSTFLISFDLNFASKCHHPDSAIQKPSSLLQKSFRFIFGLSFPGGSVCWHCRFLWRSHALCDFCARLIWARKNYAERRHCHNFGIHWS